MAIILRTTKGTALTHSELDANFTDITSSMVHSGSLSGTTLTLHKSGSQYDIDLSGLGGSGGISLGDLSVSLGAASESGSLSYNNGTGVFTFNPADLSGLGGGSSFDISAASDGELLFRTSATSADGKHVKQYYANGSYGKGITIGYTHSSNAGLNIYETSNDPQGYSEDHIILSDSSGSDLIIRNGGKEAGDGYIFLKVDEPGLNGDAVNVAKLGGPDKSVYLYHSGSNVFYTDYIGASESVIIPAPLSASSDVYLSGLSNTSKPHIVGYDAATGQLTYYSTGSFGSGGGSTDYVSGVSLNGTTLEFTGVGSAFGSGVDLSSLSGGSTDITALNNFTGSIQTEVSSLTSATSSYVTSGSYNNGNSTITLYSEDTNYTLDLSGLSGGGAVNGTASLSYDNIPVNETVNDVWYFAANNRGVATDTPTGFTPSTTQITIAASSSTDAYYYDNFNSAVVGDGLLVSDNVNLVRYTVDGVAVNENLFSSYSTSSLSDLSYINTTVVPWYPIYMEDLDKIYIPSASNDATPSTVGAYTASNPQSPSEKVNSGFSYGNWFGRALSISSSFFMTNKADGTSTIVLRSNTQSEVSTTVSIGNSPSPLAYDGKSVALIGKPHDAKLALIAVDFSVPSSPTISRQSDYQSYFTGSFGREDFQVIDAAYDSTLDKFFVASTDYLAVTELAIAQMTGSSDTSLGIGAPAEDYWISPIAIGDPFIGRSSAATDSNARTIGLNESTSTIYTYNKGDYRPSDQRDASIIAFDYSGAGTFNEVITLPSASYGHVPISVLGLSYIQRGYGGLLYSEANNTIVVGTYDHATTTPKVRVYDAASPYSLLQVIEGVWMNTACNITSEGNIVFVDGITRDGVALIPNAGDSKTFTYTVSKYDYDPNTTIDLAEDANVYVKLQTKEIASTTVNTGSFYYSSSVSNNTITFTQGDGTTETLTVDTGSSGIALTDLSVALGAAAESGSLSYNSGTGVFTFNPADLSGLGGGVSTDTGSFYISSSVVNNTITFTQGDGTTETLTVDTGSVGISLGALSVTTGTASESASLSYNNGTGVFTFNPADLSGLGGGGSTDTGSFYISSSVTNNTITFTQGDGTTETLTVDTGSDGISLGDLSISLGAAAESGSLSYNDATGVFTFNPADLSGLGAGGAASNTFATMSVGGTNLIADSTTDTLTIDTGNLISASANPATDTYTFNVLPSPQFLTKKEGETGVSAGQGVNNTTPIILTWTDQGPDHTAKSNTYWDINNANDTTYEYDRSLYQYVKIKEEGMYEIEYQLYIQGTSSSGSYGLVSLHRVDNTLTTVDQIQSRTLVGGFQGIYSDEVEYGKVYYYIPQSAIDQDESYIIMKLQGGATMNGTLTVGGGTSTNQNSTFWRFRKIEDVGTAR